jgi:7-cyano-7-deazaguanine synthase
MPTIVLLSGGLDSAVLAAQLRESGQLGGLLFIDYGQPAARQEFSAALDVADWLGLELQASKVILPTADGLGDGRLGVVAGRNLALIAHGVSWACSLGCDAVAIGATADDQNGYPDCRAAWVEAASAMCQAAYGVGVVAPLAGLDKAAIMAEGVRLGVPVHRTWTCYTPRHGFACGECAACRRMSALRPPA